MLQGAIRRQADIDALLRRAGIPKELVGAPMSRVSQAQFAALIRIVTWRLRDEFWGLCSHPVRIGSFACACRLMVEQPTLGEALNAALRFYRQMIDDFAPRLQIRDGMAKVDLVERVAWNEPLGFAESSFLYCGSGVLSWLVARNLPLAQVRLRNAHSAYNAETDWLFGAEVRFSQPRAGLCFDAKWLNLPVMQTSETLSTFLAKAPANVAVKYRDQTNPVERTRRLLRRHMGKRPLTLEEVSRMLAMTPQTLRRRLQEEGQGFQQIKDDLRRDLSIAYLERPELTLQEIARLVGFSETSTFHRAFKCWTGLAPGVYRLRSLDEPDTSTAQSEDV